MLNAVQDGVVRVEQAFMPAFGLSMVTGFSL
jgi:hypothetical protein